jgi:hypothetical protein
MRERAPHRAVEGLLFDRKCLPEVAVLRFLRMTTLFGPTTSYRLVTPSNSLKNVGYDTPAASAP